MSRVDTLTIKDFQSHKDSIIKLDPYVTAIIGLNNHGKSVILKALRKVVRDLPKGNVFIRNLPEQTKKTSIKITTNDNEVVERGVGKNLNSSTDNYYKVVTVEGEEFEYTKFSKTGIPLEVLQSLGFSEPQVFGDVEIDLNFHLQKDEDFLVRGKGLSSIRSKVLSRVTGVDVAQRAIQVGKLKERQVSQEVEKNRKERQEKILDLEKYENLEEVEGDITYHLNKIKEMEEKEENISYYKESYSNLVSIIQEALKYKQVLKELTITFSLLEIKKIYSLLNRLLIFENIDTTLRINQDKLNSIENLPQINIIKEKSNLIREMNRLSTISSRIERLEKVANIEIPIIKDISEVYDNLSFYNRCFFQFEEINKKIEKKKQEEKSIIEKICQSEKDLLEYKKELGVCPVCKNSFLKEE